MRIVALDASGGASNTARAFTPDCWLATGDLGWLDAEGRLNLSGRPKDLTSGAATTSTPRPSKTH